MGDQRVLVAFANQAGSTAGIAGEIAAVLRRAGLSVDCRVAGDVVDVTPYRAVILGSGVFVTRRRSDGGGFLARHAAELATRPVWLFSAGPIGGGRCTVEGPQAADEACGVAAVARAVGARGSAAFGPIDPAVDADLMERLGAVNHGRVRAWAADIAGQLTVAPRSAAAEPPARRAPERCGPIAAAH